MTAEQWAKAFVSTAWGGVLTGAVIGALVVTDGLGSAADVVLLAGLGILWGGMIGAVVGPVLGLPVVVAAAVLRERSDAWRVAGAVAAAVVGSVAVGAVIGGPPPQLVAMAAAGAICPGWRAWKGLGWIFEPDRTPRRPAAPAGPTGPGRSA